MQLNSLSKYFGRPLFRSKTTVTGQLVLKRFGVNASPNVDDGGEVITQELQAQACTSCGKLYSNRTFNFCTLDGTPLSALDSNK